MGNARDLLERAAHSAPHARFELPDLERRRDRRRGRRRIGATVVALAFTLAIVGLAFGTLRDRGTTLGSTGPTGSSGPAGRTGPEVIAPDGELTPVSVPPLVAGDGDYYYTRIHMVGECIESAERCEGAWTGELAATFWWNPDGSGRILVDVARDYGIAEGTFGPGEFPNNNEIDVSGFPTDPRQLADFLLSRSQEDGASPAPLISPPPGGAPQDGRMWRAITDLLQDPHVTPIVRAALLEVAAGLQGSHVELGETDPAGRAADVIEILVAGGEYVERLYVDPSTHELLAMTGGWPGEDRPFETWLVEDAGIASSTDEGPYVRSIPNAG